MKALSDTKLNYLIQKFKEKFSPIDHTHDEYAAVDHTHDDILTAEHTHDLGSDDFTGILPTSKGGTGVTDLWERVASSCSSFMIDKVKYLSGKYSGTGSYPEGPSIPIIGMLPRLMFIGTNAGFGHDEVNVIMFEKVYDYETKFSTIKVYVGNKWSGGVISGGYSDNTGMLTWRGSTDQYWRFAVDSEQKWITDSLYSYTDDQLESLAPEMILNKSGKEYWYFILGE